jgi:hypothetical protein
MIAPHTLASQPGASLSTMADEEDEAATPPRTTSTTVVDRRRQHSEAAAACSVIVMMMLLQQESARGAEETVVEPKVKKTRTVRRLFDCQGAHRCIMRDHLGPNPLYGKEFPLYFRLS